MDTFEPFTETDMIQFLITNLVNKSLSLDCNILNNYRPVSNLTFSSKVKEKAVAFHLNKYLINDNLNESLQYAYKSGHSTETALVRVKMML